MRRGNKLDSLCIPLQSKSRVIARTCCTVGGKLHSANRRDNDSRDENSRDRVERDTEMSHTLFTRWEKEARKKRTRVRNSSSPRSRASPGGWLLLLVKNVIWTEIRPDERQKRHVNSTTGREPRVFRRGFLDQKRSTWQRRPGLACCSRRRRALRRDLIRRSGGIQKYAEIFT